MTLTFQIPESELSTKAGMTGKYNPSMSHLYVLVFTNGGFLKQFEECKLVGTVTNGDATLSGGTNLKFSVDVIMTTSYRVIHFLGSDIVINEPDVSIGEEAVLESISMDSGNTAYWQRVEFPNGFTPYTYQGGVYHYIDDNGVEQTRGTAGGTSYTYVPDQGGAITVTVGDYIKKDGTKVVDGTGYFASEDVSNRIKKVPLVRNYARIELSYLVGSNFIPEKFALVNTPKSSYVAPYDADNGEYPEVYLKPDDDGGLKLDRITASGYEGIMPTNGVDESLPTTFVNISDTDNACYMYERPVPTSSAAATCVLVGGTYNETGANTDSDGLTWFKLELADENGAYIPIYRGVNYIFNINSISDTKGFASPEEAFNAAAIGDLSTSFATSTLTQISDGKGTTLWVEYIEKSVITAGDVTFRYKMFHTNPSNGDVTITTQWVELIPETIAYTDAAFSQQTVTGVPYTGMDTLDGQGGWYEATLTMNEPSISSKRTTLYVRGQAGADHSGNYLSRNVLFRVMKVQKITLSTEGIASNRVGESVCLTITLPRDLGYDLFPLDLYLEDEKDNLDPDVSLNNFSLPVYSMPSHYSSTGSNDFWYRYRVYYSDYHNVDTGEYYVDHKLYFNTSHAPTEVGGYGHVYVNNLDGYFNPAEILIGAGFTMTTVDAANSYASTLLYDPIHIGKDATETPIVDIKTATQWKMALPAQMSASEDVSYYQGDGALGTFPKFNTGTGVGIATETDPSDNYGCRFKFFVTPNTYGSDRTFVVKFTLTPETEDNKSTFAEITIIQSGT